MLILSNSAFGCSCEIVPACVTYTEADKVFVGKLESISEDEKSRIRTISAQYKVEKSYKGNVGEIEMVKFEVGSCERTFKVGESYFVYVYSNINFSRQYCDRTNILSQASADLDYVSSLSQTNPKFSIFGNIYGLSNSNLKKLSIKIERDGEEFNFSPSPDGLYNFDTAKDGLYNVQITFPFQTGIYANNTFINYENSKPIIKYSAKFTKNGCSYRAFEVFDLDKNKGQIK